MTLLKKVDFYNTFFQKDKISPLFLKILYKYNNTVFYNTKDSYATSNTKVTFISLFPQYLDAELANSRKLRVKKIKQKKLDGFGILIDGVKDIDTFLTNKFKSSTRGPIKKKIKRLESCFNIHSKMFFGKITESEYSTIMSKLKEMLTRRFVQRNNSNEAFDKWNYYLNSTITLIKNKEASLFVLYSDNDIIGISLNYHVEKIFIGHIIAYDIDYSKFGLGNTIVYKLLEWNIKNNYTIFDMGNGALDYKRIWSNFTYNYEYYIACANKSILALIIGQLQILKIQVKNALKELNVISFYRNFKNRCFNKNTPQKKLTKPFRLEEINMGLFEKINSTKIEYSHVAYKTVKKAVLDFAFSKQEHIDNIGLFKIDNNSYIIKGNKNVQKIIID